MPARKDGEEEYVEEFSRNGSSNFFSLDRGDEGSDAYVRAKGRQVSQRELTYMMKVYRILHVTDLNIFSKTFLLDTSVSVMVWIGHEESFGPFLAALIEFNLSRKDAKMAVMNEGEVSELEDNQKSRKDESILSKGIYRKEKKIYICTS